MISSSFPEAPGVKRNMETRMAEAIILVILPVSLSIGGLPVWKWRRSKISFSVIQ
jgi:hypothetical protein